MHVCICVYKYTHAHIYTQKDAHIHTWKDAGESLDAYARIISLANVRSEPDGRATCVYVHMFVCMYALLGYMYVCMYVCMYVRMFQA